MKKIIFLLLLGASASVLAQKSVLTPNGEKLPYPPATTNVLSTSGNTITSNVNGISVTAPAVNSVDATLSGKTLTTTVNGVSDATPIDISIAEPWRVQGGTTNASSNIENIYQFGKVSIGNSTGNQGRQFTVIGDGAFTKNLSIDFDNVGDGTAKSGLNFGLNSSGEGISSNRTTAANGNMNGMDFWTSNTKRLSIGNAGNIGINTDAPTAKLEVQGNVKIVDGTQAANSVLTSDANGLASWKPTATFIVDGFATTTSNKTDLVPGFQLLEGYIDLPPGTWLVSIGYLLNAKSGQFGATANTSYTLRLTLSSSNTSVTTNGFTFNGSYLVLNTASMGTVPTKYPLFASGIIRVKTTNTTTRLYVWNAESVGGLSGGGNEVGMITNNGENYLYATRSN